MCGCPNLPVADPFRKTLDEGKQSAIVTEGFLLLHTQVRMAIGCPHFFVEKLGRLENLSYLCSFKISVEIFRISNISFGMFRTSEEGGFGV